MRNMRDIWVLVLGLMLSMTVCAQDYERMAERSLTGSARYVGLAGAMTAVGGDPTAVMDNPAGLGVYRRMEVSATMDVLVDNTCQMDVNNEQTSTAFGMSQLSWVTTFATGYESGVVSNSIMLGFQRQRNYNRHYRAGYTGESYSIMDVVATKTNGLPEAALREEGRWQDDNTGWLSVLGYENYLINPVGIDRDRWVTPLGVDETITNSLNITESGYQNAYTFSWAMNYAHRLYVGAGLDVLSLSFRRSATFTENPVLGGFVDNRSELLMNGIGVTFRVGAIYRPSQWVRLGLAIHTPSYSSITLSNYGNMSAMMRPGGQDKADYCETPNNRSILKGFNQPMRLTTGVALQVLNYGLVSFQYDLAHSKQTDNMHTLRVGIEGVAINRIMIDAGFAYQSSFLGAPKTKPLEEMYYDDFAEMYALDNSSVRTDTDLQHQRSAYFVGVGVGYHGRWGTAHVAYQYGNERLDLYAHEFAAPYDMRATTHRILLTLNWHSR